MKRDYKLTKHRRYRSIYNSHNSKVMCVSGIFPSDWQIVKISKIVRKDNKIVVVFEKANGK